MSGVRWLQVGLRGSLQEPEVVFAGPAGSRPPPKRYAEALRLTDSRQLPIVAVSHPCPGAAHEERPTTRAS
jgi:hypothetical protein